MPARCDSSRSLLKLKETLAIPNLRRHGDMTPFGDEALITGGYCTAGEAWLRGMLLKMSRNGLTENAYGIPLYKFLQPSSNLLSALTELDCFLGGLVAIGIAPQINQPSTAAVRPLFSRVRYWLFGADSGRGGFSCIYCTSCVSC